MLLTFKLQSSCALTILLIGTTYHVQIFVPIHKEVHWCLAVINIRDKKFQYLDSLGSMDMKALKLLVSDISLLPSVVPILLCSGHQSLTLAFPRLPGQVSCG